MFLANFWDEMMEHLRNLDFTKPWTRGEWVVALAAAALVLLIVIIIVIRSALKGKKKKGKIVLQSGPKAEETKAVEDKPVVEPTTVVVEPAPAEEPEETTEPVEENLEEQPTEPVDEEATEEILEEEEAVDVAPEETTEPVEEEVTTEPEVKVEPAQEEEKVETKNSRYQGKYEIFQEGDSFRFRLKASNGEPLVISEIYRSEKSARSGIETVKKNIATGKFSVVSDKHGLWRFTLISSTGRTLVNSASYKTDKRAYTALESFKRFAFNDNINVVETEASSQVEVEAYDDGGKFESSTNGKYVIEEENGRFKYILKANNGHVICRSQEYASRVSCENALEKFRDTVYTGTFYISHDKNDRYQFKLYINKPRRVVMAGEIYDTKDAAIKVIKSIKRFAKDAVLK